MRRRKGLTLLELMLVMLVVTIIALIVTPRVLLMTRQAQEAQLHAHLHSLRDSLAVFNAHCGDWPGRLEDLLATSGEGLIGGSGKPINPDAYRGPYFVACPDGQLPKDPMTGERDWVYNPTLGKVHSRSPRQALDGTFYADW